MFVFSTLIIPMFAKAGVGDDGHQESPPANNIERVFCGKGWKAWRVALGSLILVSKELDGGSIGLVFIMPTGALRLTDS